MTSVSRTDFNLKCNEFCSFVAVVSVVLLPSKLLPKLICSLSANLLATYKNTRTETFAQFACNVMLIAVGVSPFFFFWFLFVATKRQRNKRVSQIN